MIPFSREDKKGKKNLSPERAATVEKLQSILQNYQKINEDGFLPSATEFNEAQIVDLLLSLLSEKRKTERAKIVLSIEQAMTSEAMEDSKHRPQTD